MEQISPDTIVFLQTHKRIWPASQRDALFWSHMKHVTTNIDKEAHDEWMVCNHSTQHEDYPVRNEDHGQGQQTNTPFIPIVHSN